MAAAVAADAQTPSTMSGADGADSPVAEARKNQSWEFGPFANWGTGLGNRDDYKFFFAG